jgi:AraC-like DNA-binding protein
MKKKQLPVLQIEQFDHAHGSFQKSDHDFYANTIPLHLKHHHFIHTPHKHDFFLCMIFTGGKGTHEIDFSSYPVRPGSVFMMSPGQTHNWKLSDDIDGYIFFHTREFYELNFSADSLQNFPFFGSVHAVPFIQANKKQAEDISGAFREILHEFEANKSLKQQRLQTLIRLLYIDLSRIYPAEATVPESPSYRIQIRTIEALIDKYYKTKKFPKEYAVLMHMSEKHLNRICKSTLNKTTTELIADRIVLEAKRLLAQTQLKVSEVALELGYEDASYFVRFFRKNSSETPAQFMKRYRS